MITAEYANAMAVNANKIKTNIAPLINHIEKAIEEAARKGEFTVPDPLKGIRTPISELHRRLISEQLSAAGYAVGLDFTISWKN